MAAISIVIALYNAAPHLPRFAASLKKQNFQDFEAIFVDDASTDGSAALVQGLALDDERFKLLRHEKNLGAGAARNAGIRAARGETLCFADPDDHLPEKSLEARYAAYKKHNAVVRALHDEIASDGSVISRGALPPGMPEVCRPAEAARKYGPGFFLSAHWTWLFPAKMLQRQEIYNEEGLRTAEDIIFLARAFFKTARCACIPETVYHWIKRENSLSTTRYTARHYADYLRCVDVFYQEAAAARQTALGDVLCNDYLSCYLPHLLRQFVEGASAEEDARMVLDEAAAICARHKTFRRVLDSGGAPPAYFTGLSMLWHALRDKSASAVQRLANGRNIAVMRRQAADTGTMAGGWLPPARFDKFDHDQGLLRARYLFFGQHPEEIFSHGGRPLAPAFAKSRLHQKGSDFTLFERILWLPVPPHADGKLELSLNGQDCGLNTTPDEVRRAFTAQPLDDRGFPPEIRAVRRLAQSESVREAFKDAWLFMDKDTEADDNAEHLYRWVARNHPEINAYFVLNEDSHDWPRLKAEGFRLIAHGGMEHKALFVLCKHLISSQMDRYIYAFMDEGYFADLRRAKFVCLQHGVIQSNMSNWLNSIPFDRFLTSTSAEHESIIGDGTSYVMTAKEVGLCGMPRYDNLLGPMQKERIVFVMPTWRSDLVGAWDGKGQKRALNPAFYSSPYVRTWSELLNAPEFKEIIERHGCRAVFFSHPCFEDYVENMPFPDFVEKRSKRHCSIQNMMKKSGMMITDFTSAAFDMAYMKRPVAYYQTESKESHAERQNWAKGYMDYDSMGFGPVCRNQAELFSAMERILGNGCVMEEKYAERVDKTFLYRDAGCCKRVFDFIQDGSRQA